jgi:hypothetical protein
MATQPLAPEDEKRVETQRLEAQKMVDRWLIAHPNISLKNPVVDYINGPFKSKDGNFTFIYIYMRSPHGVIFEVRSNGVIKMSVNSLE